MVREDPKRRAVLQSIGAGAVGVPALGSIPKRAKAKGKDGSEIKELDGKAKKRYVEKARRSEEFKQLSTELNRKEKIRVDRSKPKAFEAFDPEGNPHHVIGFELLNKNKERTGDIAVHLQNGSPVRSKASIKQDRSYDQVTMYSYKDGTLSSGEVSPSSSGVECWACTTVGDVACTVGCGVGIAVICLSVSITSGLGGLGCGAVASTICGFLAATSERYLCAACQADYGVEWACHFAGWCAEPGYCDK